MGRQNKRPELSLIIPAYCEERRIGDTLDRLAKFLKHDEFFKNKHVEVLVAAADAPDKTQEIVTKKQVKFANLTLLRPGPHVGKGRDVQYGILRASGRVVAFMDADLATPLYHLQQFYKACYAGCDVVIGTRNLLRYRPEKLRNLLAFTANTLLYRIACDLPVEDTQCGFKMFRLATAKLCFSKLTLTGWDFDVELLVIARTNKLRLKAFRLNDWQHKPYSTYNENFLTIAGRTMRDFFVITRNRLRGVYRRTAITAKKTNLLVTPRRV